MPKQKPTKTKQRRRKTQPQQGHTPSESQMVRANPTSLDNLNTPDKEQENKPQPAHNAAKGHDNQEVAHPLRRIDKYNIALTLLFTLCLVVFAGVSTYYSSKQWESMREQRDVMEKQSEIMERSLRISQRAYVGVNSIRGSLRVGQIMLVFENIGKVPAKDINVDVQMLRKTGLNIIDHQKQNYNAGHIDLFPGTFMIEVNVPLGNYTQEDVNLLLTGKQELYVSGEVRYGDGFGGLDKTGFGFRYHPRRNRCRQREAKTTKGKRAAQPTKVTHRLFVQKSILHKMCIAGKRIYRLFVQSHIA